LPRQTPTLRQKQSVSKPGTDRAWFLLSIQGQDFASFQLTCSSERCQWDAGSLQAVRGADLSFVDFFSLPDIQLKEKPQMGFTFTTPDIF